MLSETSLQWLEESLAYLSVEGTPVIEPVMGDASARSYYRIKLGSRSFILCCSDDQLSNQRFRKVSAALEQVGVMSPLVFAFDDALGLMLISDMGDTLLMDVYQMNPEHYPYSMVHRVLMSLIRLSHIPDPLLLEQDKVLLGAYDPTLLQRDFGLFTEWCLDQGLHLELTDQEKEILESVSKQLEKGFEQQPQVWVHRDFHARNLMLTENDIAVIDFQDMVKGPITYDVISLVYDAYWIIPEKEKRAILDDFYRLLQSEAEFDFSEEEYHQWVSQTAIQRLLKIVGIFFRLSLRDGKSDYLADLPRVVAHINAIHAAGHDGLAPSWWRLWRSRIEPALVAYLKRRNSRGEVME